MLKFAWVQFLAIFLVIFFLLDRMSSFVFTHKVILTCFLTIFMITDDPFISVTLRETSTRYGGEENGLNNYIYLYCICDAFK